MKAAINGAAGAMGRRIVCLLADVPDSRLVCAMEREGHPDLGKDAGLVAGTDPVGVTIGTELVGEGELMMVAELADSNSINFVARNAGGPVYVSAEQEQQMKQMMQQFPQAA